MVKFSDLIAYFEYLAKKHTGIKHSDAEKHFYRFELDDIFTDLGKNVKFKALVLEGYDFDFTDNNSDNLLKGRNGAFMIIDYEGDENSLDKINNIYDECEEIGDEIVVRILNDKKNRNVPVVRDFNMNSVKGNMIANASKGYYGMRYSFSLVSPRTNEIDKTKWTDDGEYA